MRSTTLYTLASTAALLLLQPTLAVAIPTELVPRTCPNQEADPAGIICVGDDGSL